MRYSPQYLMNQMARGRPLPTGRPEDHLHRAIQRLNHHDVERALRMGARPSAATLGILLDSVERTGPLGAGKATWCLKSLRRGAIIPVPSLALGQHLQRAGRAMPSHPEDQIHWWQSWDQIARRHPQAWTTPVRGRGTPLEAWIDKAAQPLKGALQSRFPQASREPVNPESGSACPSSKNRP